MRTLTEMHTLPPELPWISTHPAHGDREKNLNEAMTKALELRKDSGVYCLTFVIVNYYYLIIYQHIYLNYISTLLFYKLLVLSCN